MKEFVDEQLGEMKLEYTVQSPEINKVIINVMNERIKQQFENDVQEQLNLKEWTRVLSGSK